MNREKYERLIKLADEVFAVKDDPSQLDVDEKVLERLRKIHPATISEYNEGDGPCAWVLLIPTNTDLMNRFISGEVTEKELFEQTQPGQTYDAIYLCSALVLEEYRRKGITKNLALSAIKKMKEKHPLRYAFVWAFSDEGDKAAEAIAREAGLPLLRRKK